MRREARALCYGCMLTLAYIGTTGAQPTRYEACTTGISAEGLIDGLAVYGTGPEPLGETRDLVITSDGQVVALRAAVGGLWGIGETVISIPWRSVDVGETWVRTPLLKSEVGDYAPLSDEELGGRVIGSGAERDSGSDALRASELIGDLVRTREGSMFANFGVVDDLLIDVNQVGAVIVAPDAGLGFAETYAISFEDFVDRDWSRASASFDLDFQQDEVEQIEAFDC